MEKFIKLKRISKILTEEEFDNFFNELILNGWSIIYYNEIELNNNTENQILTYKVTVVVGKHNSFI